MKPAKLKETKKAQGTARVKMLIRAHLYWLQGFPMFEGESLLWCCPLAAEPGKRKVSITSKQISKAVRTINELQREYPRALPEVVGNASEWVSRAKKYLEHVKQLFDLASFGKGQIVFNLFDKDKGYKSYVQKSRYSHCTRTPMLVAAISWLHYLEREPVYASLKYLSGHQDELLAIADKHLFTAVEVVHLIFLTPKITTDLVRLLANFDELAVATVGVKDYVRPLSTTKITTKKTSKKGLSCRVKPPEIKIEMVSDFVTRLLRMKAGQRRWALYLFNTIGLKCHINAWAEWWHCVKPLMEKIANNAKYINGDKYETVCKLQGRLSNFLEQAPDEINLTIILDHICCVASSGQFVPTVINTIDTFSNLKDGRPSALKMLCHVHRIYHEFDKDNKFLTSYFEALSKFIKICKKSSYVAPWKNVDCYYSTPESDLLCVLDRKTAPVFFEILFEVNKVAFRPVKMDELRSLAYVVSSGVKKEGVIALSRYLLEAGVLSKFTKTLVAICAALQVEGPDAEQLLMLYQNTEDELRHEHILDVTFVVVK